MQVLQIGISGFGNRWLNVVQETPEVEHCAFVEINPAIIDQQVAAYNLDRSLIYPTLAEALEHVRPDAIIDVSPAMFHRKHAEIALPAGIPMLMEKPLSITPEDAQAILDCANETGTLLTISQDYRYHPPIQTLRHAMADADLGAIGAVSVNFYRPPTPGGYRSELDYPLLFVLSVHHMDVMRMLFGSEVTVLNAHSWNPPYSPWPGDACAALTLSFTGGPILTYDASWCAQAQTTSWNAHWRLDCEKGVITLVDDVVTVYQGDEATVYPTVEQPRFAQHYLLHEFRQAILGTGGTPATAVQDNIHSINIVFDAIAYLTSARA